MFYCKEKIIKLFEFLFLSHFYLHKRKNLNKINNHLHLEKMKWNTNKDKPTPKH